MPGLSLSSRAAALAALLLLALAAPALAVKPATGRYSSQAAGAKAPAASFELTSGRIRRVDVKGMNEHRGCYLYEMFNGPVVKGITVRGGRIDYVERGEVIVGTQQYVRATLRFIARWSTPRLMSGRTRVDVSGRVVGLHPGRLVRCSTGWIRFRLAKTEPVQISGRIVQFAVPGEVRVDLVARNDGDVASPGTTVTVRPMNTYSSGGDPVPSAAMSAGSGCSSGVDIDTVVFTCAIGTLPAHGRWTATLSEQWDQPAVDRACGMVGPFGVFNVAASVTSPLDSFEAGAGDIWRDLPCPAGQAPSGG